MKNEDVVKSEAFRAINFLIDQKAEELNFWMIIVKERFEKAFEEKDTIRTRISDEDEKYGKKEIPANTYPLKEVRDAINLILKFEAEIGELQRFKLRLLNDYDFTHGDDSIQRVVFNDKP